MSENFRERLNIKLWNFDCPNRECVADFLWPREWFRYLASSAFVPTNAQNGLPARPWNFDCPNRECVADFVEFHLLQFMLFEKTGKKLPICTRLEGHFSYG